MSTHLYYPQASRAVRGAISDHRQLVTILLFLALSAILLCGASTNYQISVSDTGFDSLTADITDAVSTGSILRRIGFSALGVFSAVCLLRTHIRVVNLKAAAFLGGLGFWAFTSILWSDDPLLSLRRLALLATMVLGAIWLGATRPKDLPRFALFSSGLFIVIGFAVECVLGSFRPFADDYRFAGIFHPNHQAINAAILFCAATALARQSPRHRWTLRSAAGVAILVLFLTRSRTAFISLVAAQLILWATFVVRRPRRTLLVTGTTLLLCFLLYAATFTPNMLKSSVLLGRDTNALTLITRYELWKDLSSYFWKRPLTGYGYGAFFTVKRIIDISELETWGVGEAHSAYFEVLLALGATGLMLLTGAIISIWSTARRAVTGTPSVTFAFAMMAFSVVHSFTESAAYVTPELQFLVLWGIATLALTAEPTRKTTLILS